MIGYIYKITSDKTNKIYIGSTTMNLKYRLRQHISTYYNKKNVSSIEIIKYGNAKIELLEQIEFINIKKLKEKEGEYIKINNDICVNKQIAGRTYQERYNEIIECECKKKIRKSHYKKHLFSNIHNKNLLNKSII